MFHISKGFLKLGKINGEKIGKKFCYKKNFDIFF